MSRRTVLHRPSALDAQLRAQALSADRANTPTTLLVVAGALVAATLIYMALGVMSLTTDRAALRDAQEDSIQITALVDQIKQLSSTELDLSTIYPEQRRLQQIILEQISNQSLSYAQPPTVRNPRDVTIIREPEIHEIGVDCQLNSPESLENILAWINGILHDERLAGQAFISQIQLSPDISGPGWSGRFQVSLYEYKP